MERQWGVHVDLVIDGVTDTVPSGLADEVYHLVHEAVTNAVRHSGGSDIRVELGSTDRHVRLVVTDNGRGFPFVGELDQSMLAARAIGPRSLRERTVAAGGQMRLCSSSSGARVEIELPCSVPTAPEVPV